MDSKLKKQVILAVTAIMVCVVGVVFVVNYFATGSFLPKGLQKNKDRQAETEETEELLRGDASIYKEYDLNPKKDPYAFLADPDFFMHRFLRLRTHKSYAVHFLLKYKLRMRRRK